MGDYYPSRHKIHDILPTIYTTNLGAQDLVRCLDKRLVSRIVGTTYPVHFGWGDWRKSKPLTLEEAFGGD